MSNATYYRSGLASVVALLAACTSPEVVQMAPVDTGPRAFQPHAQGNTHFECSASLPAVHRALCSSEQLMEADRDLVDRYHRLANSLDLPGALLLEANQRQWQLSRANQCGLSQASKADEQAQACLRSLYRQRMAVLNEWPVPAASASHQGAHALASYARYRLVDGQGGAICERLADALNADLVANGRPNPGRLTGATVLAGTHAADNRANLNGRSVVVSTHATGPFGGYQIRPRGLSVDAKPLADDRTLPRWVAEQPNYGGRAHASSSQTGDYGSLDVFEMDGQTWVLINETWGFYSPAARGESAYAGVYRLQGDALERACLYQTYLTPPRTDTLAGLAVYQQLADELEFIAGDPLPEYAQHERRDNYQSWKERQWTLLNLPLLGADAWTRYGRDAAIRSRNDAALDALFAWSERNLRNKLIYRRVMPLLQPAQQELLGMFSNQGLSGEESQRAADLLLHETLARAMENLQSPGQSPEPPLAPFAAYAPRYDIAPTPGALERGRRFATLHSVLLNNAPLQVVEDFIAYETDALQAERGRGPDNDSATMAAVDNPAALSLLLRSDFEPDQRNAWGKTALMTAAQLDRTDAVTLLLQHGADVHSTTTANPGAGVGGPDRKEASDPRHTALLFAASQSGAATIDTLLAAGAARQEWPGYDQQVCTGLSDNPQLDQPTRERLRNALCATRYEPPPLTRAKPGNLRAGEVYVVRDAGEEYAVTLEERPSMSLFGRPLQISPDTLRKRLRKIGTNVGTAVVRRGGGRLAGPLTLVFDDLSANTEELLKVTIGFPVSPGTSPVGGYTLKTSDAQTVLSVTFDPQRNDVEGTWRALFSAAYTQGFTPTGAGFVTIDIRGQPVTHYQLAVQETQQ